MGAEPLTDFGGALNARLERLDSSIVEFERYKSSHYIGLCTASYNLDIMRRLLPGMIFAVPNFRSDDKQRYTLFELVGFRPIHFGATAITQDTLPEIRREVFEKVRYEWVKGSKAAYIQFTGNPINYDLVIEGSEYGFERGWSYPLIGGEVKFLTTQSISRLINSGLPTGSPDIATLISHTEVKVKVDAYALTSYHVGVFAYTGGGKSNLVSHLIRTVVNSTPSTKVVIFDVAGEYSVNLADMMLSDAYKPILLIEEEASSADQLSSRFTLPKGFTDNEIASVNKFAEALIQRKRVFKVAEHQIYTHHLEAKLTYHDIGEMIGEKIDYYTEKKNATLRVLLTGVLAELSSYLKQRNLGWESPVGEEIDEFIDGLKVDLSQKPMQNLVSDLRVVANFARHQPDSETYYDGFSDSQFVKLLNDALAARLVVVSFTDVLRLRKFAANVCNRTLQFRKSKFRKDPPVFFVFDEAQEMIPKEVRDEDGTRYSSYAVEQLLRQGRKYGLGGLIATQRLAYLNTNVLQQIHTYFVGTLPRPYDRTTISDQFALDPTIVDRTLELQSGEWLLSSYSATGVRNMPMFIRTPNNEGIVIETLKKLGA
ncbi:MAG: ATP-binding protein [Thermoprotei archaeon]